MEGVDSREILETVRRIELATRRTVQSELAGRYHSVFKGQGMAFSEVRNYSPGDDIRHIDWNVSARHRDHGLFVKTFHEERELTVFLMVDLSGSAGLGTRRRTKRRLLAEVGALLSFTALQNNDRVGLAAFTDQVEVFLPPRKGRSHGLRVIREIAEHVPQHRRTDMSEALRHVNRVQRRRAVVFLISDFLDDDFVRPLRVAAARHDLIAVRVLDPIERELPDLGLVQWVDAETGERQWVDTRDRRVRAAYADRQRGALEASARALERSGVDLIDLRTPDDLAGPMVRFFRQRALRMGRGG